MIFALLLELLINYIELVLEILIQKICTLKLKRNIFIGPSQ